jgi:hypothetical protein
LIIRCLSLGSSRRRKDQREWLGRQQRWMLLVSPGFSCTILPYDNVIVDDEILGQTEGHREGIGWEPGFSLNIRVTTITINLLSRRGHHADHHLPPSYFTELTQFSTLRLPLEAPSVSAFEPEALGYSFFVRVSVLEGRPTQGSSCRVCASQTARAL